MCKSRGRVPMWISCMSVVLIGTMAQNSEAQRSGRSGLRLGNVSAVQLIVLEDVQKHLKLTEEQKEKTVALHDTLIAERRKMFAEVSKESGDRGAKLAEMNKRTTTKLESILDAAQRQRLKEILLQVNGAAELLKDKIAEAIGITDDQKEKLADIQRSNAKTRSDSRKKLDGSSALIRNAKMAELHREAEKRLLEVLTAEQRKHFEAMQGKKITLELYQL
jgi:hypothetical protein